MKTTGTSEAVQLKPGQATDYLSFLSKAVQEINGSLNYRVTLKNVAHAMVPEISDFCAVDIVQANGRLERLATAHLDPKKVKMALQLGKKYPRDPKAPTGSPKVFATGEPMMFNGITDDLLVASAINDEHLQMMRDLKFYSIIIVPITSRGKKFGTITFVWAESGKSYSLADLAFAETLASVAGTAIDNSELYQAAHHMPSPSMVK